MPTIPQERVNALLVQKPPFTEAEIRTLIHEEPEIAVFLILEQSRRLREFESQPAAPLPSTPSGMIPPYQKPIAENPLNQKCRTHSPKPGSAIGRWH